jgi:hypothetical protein
MSLRPDTNYIPKQDTRPAAGWLKVSEICYFFFSDIIGTFVD